MDIALKQRLVGAMVIVALGVIFIPMLLDGPGGPDRRRLDMEIPPPPAERVQTRRLPLDPDDAEEEPEPARVSAAQPVPVGPRTPGVEERRPAAPERAPADPAPADGRATVPEAGPAAPASAPAAAEAPAPGAAPGEWVLQLGSFGRRENADRLVAQLSGAGLPAWSDAVESDGRLLHRVRAGAWASRGEAMDAAARIGELVPGVEASLRRLSTPGDATGESQALASEFAWMVQAGVFASEINAVALRDRLRAAGLVASIEPAGSGGSRRYRVRVGPQMERAEADAVLARLEDEFGISGLIVSHP